MPLTLMPCLHWHQSENLEPSRTFETEVIVNALNRPKIGYNVPIYTLTQVPLEVTSTSCHH